MKISCVLAVYFVLVFASLSFGFNSDEHAAVAQKSFNIATKVVFKNISGKLSGSQRTGFYNLVEGMGDKKLHYGDLSTLPDFLMNFNKIIMQNGVISGYPKDPNELDFDVLNNCPKSIDILQSAHLNTGHFGLEAIGNFRSLHENAISIAAKGNLFYGLVRNSFADHFLADFFAPGHMITPRNGLHDAVSLGMHDYYNRRGDKIGIRSERIADLKDLCNISDVKQIAPAGCNFVENCGGACETTFHGDSYLNKNSAQADIMSLIGAVSVIDIYRAYGTSTEYTSFDRFEWQYRTVDTVTVDGKQKYIYRPMHASIQFAEYVNRDKLLAYEPIFAVSAELESFLGKQENGRGVFSLEFMPIGILATKDAFRNKDGKPISNFSLGLTAGYSFLKDDKNYGNRVFGRLILPVTAIDSQFSIIAGRTWYGGTLDFERPFFGAKYELGFGLLFLSFGINYDYQVNNSQIRPGWSATSGVSFSYPFFSLLR